jgi:diadenosine tetraphosphate (Ap4A) HIT family hydrolase
MKEICNICLSNEGKKRISPGPTIYEGKYWMVEHAYPCQYKGWLVIVAKRHITSIHELKHEEFQEYTIILERAVKLLSKEISCEKVYNMTFGEMPGFTHLHYHAVAVPHDLAPELRGAKIFAFLKEPEKSLSKKDIKEFCEYLKKRF